MITCYLLGGLGNQLFQIFTVFSYAIDCGNMPIFLNTPTTYGMTNRITYWNTLLQSLQKWTSVKINPHLPLLREKQFHYSELPVIKEPFDVRLSGYFQSYKYFEKNKYKILEFIKVYKYKQDLKQRVNFDFHKTISMHFRIGDYKLLQDKHPILPEKYYTNSLRFILDNIKHKKPDMTVLYFYEQSDLLDVDKIITTLIKEFTEVTFVPIGSIFQDWEQLIIMSCCRYNIIANSTFSWWGAYLNNNYDEIVCYPSVWFGPGLTHNTKDLFPPIWTKINI